jgi:hypothetical protein
VGCLRGLFVRIGCLVVLVALLALGWLYREQLMDMYRRARGLPARARVTYVASDTTPTTAETALRRLSGSRGPAYVELTAGQVGALIGTVLERTGSHAVESLQVGLLTGEIRLRGSLDMTQVPPNLLGPLSGALDPRESIEIGGPLTVDPIGRLLWSITSLSVKSFPFPRSTIPALVRQLRIPGAEGNAVPVPGLTNLRDVLVTPDGVRLYRKAP